MIALSIAFLVIFALYMRAMFTPSQKGIALRTLIFDPLFILIAGFLLVFLVLRILPPKDAAAFRKRRNIIKVLCTGFILCFMTGAAMYYFGVLEGPYHTPGNDFAWNGYLDLLGLKVMNASTPTYYSWWKNAIALLLFAVQPLLFWLIYRLGFTIGGYRDLPLWTKPKR